ncbi:MAG: hypothetical protein NT075_00700 [Chloroflexi bacterium]|nr:hypothetical protein [Chloroflexota bacterium]
MMPKTWLTPLLIFIVVGAIHGLSPVITLADSAWTVAIASSIIHEHNTDLNEYNPALRRDDWRVEHLPSGDYSYLPIGAPLLAVPFVWLAEKLAPWWFGIADLRTYFYQRPIGSIPGLIEHPLASLVMALTAVGIYAIARLRLTVPRALLLVFIFAFCTSAWSTASRALWQHGPSMLMLMLALWLLLKAQQSPRWAQYAALPLAMAYVVRPTNSLSVFILSLYVLLYFRPYFIRYCLWGLLIAVPFIAYNFSLYGGLLSSYYQAGRIGATGQLSEALLGNLISPARGLLIYSPIFLFAFVGAWLDWRRPTLTALPTPRLSVALALIVMLHWLAISSFPHWTGGWSIGPRLFADMTPYLVYLLIPVIAGLPKPRTIGALTRLAPFGLTLALSFFMHWHGATDQNVDYWNRVPNDVDQHGARIWDWRDPPFGRGFGPALWMMEPDALQYSDDAAHHLQHVALLLTSLDTSKTSLEITLPVGVTPVTDAAFEQQFSVATPSNAGLTVRTKESFGFKQKRHLELTLAPALWQQASQPPSLQIVATATNIWWRRQTKAALPVDELDQRYSTILEASQ